MENNNQNTQTQLVQQKHRLFEEPEIQSDEPMQSNSTEVKNYSPIYWNLLGIGLVLSVASSYARVYAVSNAFFVGLILLILTTIYIVYFVKITNEAWKAIGKSSGWLLGLVIFVPFGFWVVFFVVRHYLKPRGMWVSKNKSFHLTK